MADPEVQVGSFRRILKSGSALDAPNEGAGCDNQAAALINAFEASGKGWFWETNREGLFSFISETAAQALGGSAPDLLGRPFAEFVTSEAAGNSASERTLAFYLSSRVAFQDLIIRAKTNGEAWWSVSGTPIQDEVGRFFGFRGFASDLTKMRQSEVELDRLARLDSLTGLSNREMLRRALDDALVSAARRKHRCSIFLLDLDRFKGVNDTLGHPAGDTLLRLVALRLREVIGERGQVGRLGGDEFEVVLPTLSAKDELSSLGQAVIDSLSRPYTINGTAVTIGATIGIVTSDYDDRTSDDLMRDADLALYAAKAAGKGCYRFFHPSMHDAARQRQVLEADLRVALEKQQLRLLYQPCVDASSEAVTCFEALIRWEHPERGSVSPAEFIPVAEEIGLIGEIGEWVLRTACEEATNWPDNVAVAVNLSPLQFKSSLPSTVRMVLNEMALSPGRLELEITEGVFLNNDDHVLGTIEQLKSLGVKLALDDFGTGYSSLSYLLRVPFDKIKIDRSFVSGAWDPQSRNAALIRAMVGLANELKMQTTAEGVETLEELQLVRKLGCALVQGYYFAKPMSAREARQLALQGAPARPDAHLTPREPRTRIIRAALLHFGNQVKGGRLRNISSGGALVECREEVLVGSELRMDFGAGIVIGATVRWTKGTQFGVQFKEPFDLRLMQQSLARGPTPAGR